ncbi:MAG: RNA polymerase sigma factor [Isosphaeraceae bacterium]
MVRRVCRRALTDSHQAQHAFQATFPVLVQQAGSVRHKDSAASWLYGVAYRVASYARSAESRRRKHEALHSVRQEQVSPTNQYESAELARLLDEELCCLPERFRAPIVLCDLEDVTHEQAAGRLTLSRAGPKKCLRKPLKRLPAPFRRPLERFEVVDDVVRPDLAPGQSALDAVSFG